MRRERRGKPEAYQEQQPKHRLLLRPRTPLKKCLHSWNQKQAANSSSSSSNRSMEGPKASSSARSCKGKRSCSHRRSTSSSSNGFREGRAQQQPAVVVLLLLLVVRKLPRPPAPSRSSCRAAPGVVVVAGPSLAGVHREHTPQGVRVREEGRE